MAENPSLTRCPAQWLAAVELLITQYTELHASVPGSPERQELAVIGQADMRRLGIREKDKKVASSIRIDRQGSFTRGSYLMANIQGQIQGASVFHVNIRTEHEFGNDRIKEAMQESLRDVRSVELLQ